MDSREEFLKSQDFMRLGKSISSGQWQSVMMVISRMQDQARRAGILDFERGLSNIRQCALRKDVNGAKNALAVLVNKRVSLINKDKE